MRADAQVALLRKGVIGAKNVRHGGGVDALVVHPVKEEDEITANDDNGDDGTMPETATLIRRRRRHKRQKANGSRGKGGIYVANRRLPVDCYHKRFFSEF